jgi:hypothetical protein
MKRLEVAVMRKILQAIIQRWRSLCHRLMGRPDEIEEYLNRHKYTLPPELLIELERRSEGQYGD